MPQWLKSVNLVTAPVVHVGPESHSGSVRAATASAPHLRTDVVTPLWISLIRWRLTATVQTAPFSGAFKRAAGHGAPAIRYLKPRPRGRRGAETDTARRIGARPVAEPGTTRNRRPLQGRTLRERYHRTDLRRPVRGSRQTPHRHRTVRPPAA